jgi:hypothetical protein
MGPWIQCRSQGLIARVLPLIALLPFCLGGGEAVSDAAGLRAAISSGVQHIVITDHLNFTAQNDTQSLHIRESTKSLRVRPRSLSVPCLKPTIQSWDHAKEVVLCLSIERILVMTESTSLDS